MARLPTFERSMNNENVPTANVMIGDAGQTYKALGALANVGTEIIQDVYKKRVDFDTTMYILNSKQEYQSQVQDRFQKMSTELNEDGTVNIYDDNGNRTTESFSKHLSDHENNIRNKILAQAPFEVARKEADSKLKDMSTEFILKADAMEWGRKQKTLDEAPIKSAEVLSQRGVKDVYENGEASNLDEIAKIYKEQNDLHTEIFNSGMVAPADRFERDYKGKHATIIPIAKALTAQGKIGALLDTINIDPSSPEFKKIANRMGISITTKNAMVKGKSGKITELIHDETGDTLYQQASMVPIGVQGQKVSPFSKYISAEEKVKLIEGALTNLPKKKKEDMTNLRHKVKQLGSYAAMPVAHANASKKAELEDRFKDMIGEVIAAPTNNVEKVKLLSYMLSQKDLGEANTLMPFWNDAAYAGNKMAILGNQERIAETMKQYIPDSAELFNNPESMAELKSAMSNSLDQMRASYVRQLREDGSQYAVKYFPKAREAYEELNAARATGDLGKIAHNLTKWQGINEGIQKNLGQPYSSINMFPKSEMAEVVARTNNAFNSLAPNEKDILNAHEAVKNYYAHNPAAMDALVRHGLNPTAALLLDTDNNKFAVAEIAKVTANEKEIIESYSKRNGEGAWNELWASTYTDSDLDTVRRALGKENLPKFNVLAKSIALHMANDTSALSASDKMDQAVERFLKESYVYEMTGDRSRFGIYPEPTGGMIFSKKALQESNINPGDISDVEEYTVNNKTLRTQLAPHIYFSNSENDMLNELGATNPVDKLNKFLDNNMPFTISSGATKLKIMVRNKRGQVSPLMLRGEERNVPVELDLKDIVNQPDFKARNEDKQNPIMDIINSIEDTIMGKGN